jgi:hypothetical protein
LTAFGCLRSLRARSALGRLLTAHTLSGRCGSRSRPSPGEYREGMLSANRATRRVGVRAYRGPDHAQNVAVAGDFALRDPTAVVNFSYCLDMLLGEEEMSHQLIPSPLDACLDILHWMSEQYHIQGRRRGFTRLRHTAPAFRKHKRFVARAGQWNDRFGNQSLSHQDSQRRCTYLRALWHDGNRGRFRFRASLPQRWR